jgi:hypothetical protein
MFELLIITLPSRYVRLLFDGLSACSRASPSSER